MTLKSDPKLEEKLNFYLKNDMNRKNSENLHFDGILFSKVCNN